MADDIVQQLRTIAQSDPNPARRREAARRLHRRNETVSGNGDLRSALTRKVAESRARTERLRSEENPRDGFLADAEALYTDADKIPGFLAHAGRSVVSGIEDVPDYLTGGGYRKARDAMGVPIFGQSALDDVRRQDREADPAFRSMGRTGTMIAGGAALGGAMPGAGVLRTGVTAGAADYPLNVGRRVAEGEGATDALVGGAVDSAVTAGTAGLLRGAGKVLDAASRNPTVARYREALLGGRYKADPARAAGSDKELASLADEAAQSTGAGMQRMRLQAQADYDQAAARAFAIDEGVPPEAVASGFRRILSQPQNMAAGQPKEEVAAFLSDPKIVRYLTPSENGAIPLQQLHQLRQEVGRMADFGSVAPSPQAKLARELYGQINDTVSSISTPAGQALREADAAFAGTMGKLRRANDVVYRGSDEVTAQLRGPVPRDAMLADPSLIDEALQTPASKEVGAQGFFRYAAEDSVPAAGARQRQAAEVSDLVPEAGEAIQRQRDAAAFRNTRVRNPLGEGPENLRMREVGSAGLRMVGGNVRALQGRVLAPANEAIGPALTPGAAIPQGVVAGEAMGVLNPKSRKPAEPPPPQLPENYSALPPLEQMKAAAVYSREKQRHAAQKLMRKRPKPKRDEFVGQTVDPIDGTILE